MKNIKKYLTIILLLAAATTTLIFTLSCDNNPNGPEEPPPGRRDYVWEIDTLDIAFNDLSMLWGAAEDDVWAIGDGGEADNFVWHFDGESWNSYGSFVGTVPFGINGFSESDIWIGGQDGRISYYDGETWKLKYQISNPGYYNFYGITDFAGESSSNMYAVGFADSNNVRLSLIYHYDGIDWKKIPTTGINLYLYRIRKESNRNSYYLGGFDSSNFETDSNAVLYFYENELLILDKEPRVPNKLLTIQKIGKNVYMVLGQDIFLLKGIEKELIFSINNSDFGFQVYGRNEKDIVLRMLNGVAHYNGANVVYLITLNTNTLVTDILVFPGSLIVLCYDLTNKRNLIYRGYYNIN